MGRGSRATVSAMLLVALAAATCGEEAQMKTSIQDVRSRHEAELMATPGVVSVGIGLDEDGETVIVVGIDRNRAETQARLPQTIEGYRVRVEVTGTIKAQ